MLRRRLPALLLAFGALISAGVAAPAVHAEVLHLSGGRVAGVTLAHGVASTSLPGAMARAAVASSATSSGQLTYHGGPVVHASTPYLILWTPPGQALPTGTQSLLTRYFTDVAADSGTSANMYGVSRQYYDGTGFADYRQTFSSAQVITDPKGYPGRDKTNCPNVSPTYPTCVSDAQLMAEIQRLITADRLPTDGPASSESLPSTAPIYFIVLPSDVNICAPWGCADDSGGGFCAYHSSFTDSANSTSVLYATIPTLIVGTGQNPKACQWDGNPTVQEPNGSAADVVLKYLSHEHNETITDPFGDAWWDPNSQNEGGDNCNAYGNANPSGGTSPSAFAPALGGLATGSPFTASFTVPAAPTPPNTAVTFDPSASSASTGWSSATWNFGDGSATTFNSAAQTLSPVTHAYAADGTYPATLTLVDSRGNLARTSRTVTVDEPPTASSSVTTGSPGAGQPTGFDATASSDPDGSIASYAWNFGDGGTGSGATPTHVYAAPGTYTAVLTVTDTDGASDTTSATVPVVGPLAQFTAPAPQLSGIPLTFVAASPGPAASGPVTDAWSFDGGSVMTGASVTHAFATPGPHTATLMVTDSAGNIMSVTQTVTVLDDSPTAAFSVTTPIPATQQAVAFDASGSTDPDGTVSAYHWTSSDRWSASGITPSHQFAGSGTYTVTLTVTDSSGVTSTPVSHVVTVYAPPQAAFTIAGNGAPEGSQVSFDAAPASDAGPGGPIARYVWSFSGGTTMTGARANHTYPHVGSYPVTLTVINAVGLSNSVTQWVIIGDEVPSVVPRVIAAKPLVGSPVTFDGSASSDSDGHVVSYLWNFGDGHTASGVRPSHSYRSAGQFPVILTVVGSDGKGASWQLTVKVVVPGRITRVRARQANGGPTLIIAVNGPGRLSVGNHRVDLNAAGSTQVQLRLSPAQLRALADHRTIRIRTAIAFSPDAGASSRQIYTMSLHRPLNARRYTIQLRA